VGPRISSGRLSRVIETGAAERAPVSLALRRYFYLTATIAGAAVMIIEILGAKMLAPYLGVSHFAWTAQITATLLALAIGYYVGGWLADKSPDVTVLYWSILLGAAYLAASVTACEPLAYWCLGLTSFALGSLLASLTLFFVPLALLAMVGPFLVRMLTNALSDVGRTVGRLIAFGTLGGVAGTILIGYVIIPLLPNSWTMYATALVLALLSVSYLSIWGGKRRLAATAALVTVAIAFIAFSAVRLDRARRSGWANKFYRNSVFGTMQVIEYAGNRYYLNDYMPQNCYDPVSEQSTSLFTYMLHWLARGYTRKIDNVLCLGLGGGIVPMEFAREGVDIDAVEINPAVIPMAQRWFGLDPSKVHITIGDGREFLNRCTKKYDAVLVDVFLGDSSPSQLVTREAFTAIRKVLQPGGTVVINVFVNFKPGADFFANSLYQTLASVFPHVRIHTAGKINAFYVASDHPLHVFDPPDFERVHPSVRDLVESAWSGLVEPGHPSGDLALHLENGRVLTDDFNPLEFYDAANREHYRRKLAMQHAARGELQPRWDE
jgi:predicted membrane-bound spermidine synthase